MQGFAQILSKVFNVFSNSLAAMLVAIMVDQSPLSQKLLWLLVGTASAIIPAAVYFYKYRKGDISSFWSPALKERFAAHLAWAAAAGIFSLVAFILKAPSLVLALGLVFLVIGLLDLALSHTFKISVHSQTLTIFILTCILTVSVNLIFLTILIVLVGWSRVYLKAHSLLEVSLGVLSSVAIVFVVFSLFGLATF